MVISLFALLNFLEFLILSPCFAVVCVPIGSYCGLLFFSFVGVAYCPLLEHYVDGHSFFDLYSAFVVALLRRFAARDLAEVLLLGALAIWS